MASAGTTRAPARRPRLASAGARRQDPAQLLPEATRRRAQLLIPAHVRRLVNFHPSVLPGVPPPPTPSVPRRGEMPLEPRGEVDPRQVLVTGVNLRVTEATERRDEMKLNLKEILYYVNFDLIAGLTMDIWHSSIRSLPDCSFSQRRG